MLGKSSESHKRRSSNVEIPVNLTEVDPRFWSKVRVGGPDECWIWQGSTSGSKNHQYGQYTKNGGGHQRHVGAHVYAYELVHGEGAATGQKVCHDCDTPPCVNPRHLFIGDHTANMRDAGRKGRLSVPHPGRQKVTAAQVEEIRDLIATGELYSTIAKRYGITPGAISQYASGTRRQHDAPLQPRLVRKAS